MTKSETKKVEKKPKKNKEFLKLEKENNQLNEKVIRLSAEIQNITRRNSEEREKLLKYEGEDFIKNLLSVVDNFERAIALDDNVLDDEVSKFLSGFKMMYADLINILKNIGVVEVKAMGEEFDPNLMEAVITEKIIEEEPNIVLEVFQKGYTYKDKLLRPAMVKVNE